MNILVSGGAGFIGSHLCERLLSDGHFVRCIDDLSTGDLSNIGHLFDYPGFRFSNAGVESCGWHDADAVFHLASPAAPGDINRLPVETLKANVEGTAHLMRSVRTSKFMFLSSMKVLGDCPRVAPYIHGKRYGEYLCLDSGAKVARLASVYGPRMRLDDSRVIPVFINKALAGEPLSVWNGGRQLDSFCYIDDMIEALVRFMDSDETGLIEFGHPEPVSIIDLAKLIIELSGPSCMRLYTSSGWSRVSPKDSEILTNENVLVVDECHKVPDLSAAKEKFGWSPQISLREGLERTIRYVAEKNQKNHLHPGHKQLGAQGDGAYLSASL